MLKIQLNHQAKSSLLALIGFILSPLSWWNDLVVNIPLAYAFSLPFTLLHVALFLPTFILGYWLTNILGFILLHKGALGLVRPGERPRNLKHDFVVSLAYTLLIVILVWWGWLPSPLTFIQ